MAGHGTAAARRSDRDSVRRRGDSLRVMAMHVIRPRSIYKDLIGNYACKANSVSCPAVCARTSSETACCFARRWTTPLLINMLSMFRQMVTSQSSRLARTSMTRGYASQSGNGAVQGLSERAQAIGASVLKVAERALGSYAEPVMYNLKVAGSIAKQVYIAEKLAPPTSLSQIQAAYRQIWACVSKASWWTHSLPAGEWRKVAVYGVEAIGIFSIGEIVR